MTPSRYYQPDRQTISQRSPYVVAADNATRPPRTLLVAAKRRKAWMWIAFLFVTLAITATTTYLTARFGQMSPIVAGVAIFVLHGIYSITTHGTMAAIQNRKYGSAVFCCFFALLMVGAFAVLAYLRYARSYNAIAALLGLAVDVIPPVVLGYLVATAEAHCDAAETVGGQAEEVYHLVRETNPERQAARYDDAVSLVRKSLGVLHDDETATNRSRREMSRLLDALLANHPDRAFDAH